MPAAKIAYLDCFSGISGDMFLSALLAAGLDKQLLMDAIIALPFEGYELSTYTYEDKGISGMRLEVSLNDQQQPVRHLSDITAMIHSSPLSDRVKNAALAIFQTLAEAEATVHGTGVNDVHFHEVGAVDSLIDIVGAAIGIDALGIDQLYASPLPMTTGTVKTAHGVLPVPAPATLEILRRVSAPWKPSTAEGELVTPTGAAILATLARFEMPPIAIERVGYGFGKKRLPWPNCLRLCLGGPLTIDGFATGQADTDWVIVIESHIDNMDGEQLGDLMERLLASGALDVGYIPMQMKKNRPATLLTIICHPEDGERLAVQLLGETATLGVRIQHIQRLKARRSQVRIETPFGPLLVKVKRLGSRIISASPEYEECRRVAREQSIPLAEVYTVARNAAQTFITTQQT
jgi:pyridinium-3,5-bisthiocarboxylic acid mononucleotide nickel chelatase